MIDLNGQEEALAIEACEDHSHYGEQEEQDFGSYEPEPHSGTWGEL